MWILSHVALSGCPSESLRRAALNPRLKVQASQHFIMGRLVINAFTLQTLLPGDTLQQWMAFIKATLTHPLLPSTPVCSNDKAADC